MKKNVAVIFGGVSSEYEISLKSAFNVLSKLSLKNYNVIIIGITKSGRWLKYNDKLENIKDDSWENHPFNTNIVFSTDRKNKGIFKFNKDKFEFEKIDVVFPVLHGKNGEDGKIQSLLELADLPFVGCSSVASANCMDKTITNLILKEVGIKKIKSYWFYFYDYEENSEKIFTKIEEKIGDYPIFVKPARSGSSIGVRKVSNKTELSDAIKLTAKEDYKILVEEAIIGKELECAILGNENCIVSSIGEIFTNNGFYDYDAKYLNNETQMSIPANIDDEISKKIQNIAIKAYKTMECSGLARVDFFLKKSNGEIILNEINTIPGFTNVSMYPRLMDAFGFDLENLLDKLIDLAFLKTTKLKSHK
ncbi:MAG: D-alanine--D-alanine ligase [Oscillospiraceae bacterium]|jgi:D-alanine-D-alanine ligase|nr:D-alanine--D-alanine ligase [Oscillospiraceae bacterium]